MSNDDNWGYCPFCGNQGELRLQVEAHIEGGFVMYILCAVCAARGPEVVCLADSQFSGTEEELASYWDRQRQETVERWQGRIRYE